MLHFSDYYTFNFKHITIIFIIIILLIISIYIQYFGENVRILKNYIYNEGIGIYMWSMQHRFI